MKVTAEKKEANYKPFTLTIEFESHEEAEAIYGLFNFVPVCDVLRKRGVQSHKLREAMMAASGQYICGEVDAFRDEMERRYG